MDDMIHGRSLDLQKAEDGSSSVFIPNRCLLCCSNTAAMRCTGNEENSEIGVG